MADDATLPVHGRPAGELLDEVRAGRGDDADWRGGRTFSLVYNPVDPELERLQEEVAREYLHENYLNSLTSRYENGIIPNVAEFLSENWAIALYHEWFGDFCLRMRQSLQQMHDVQLILEKAFDETKNGEGITRDKFNELRSQLDSKTVKLIEDETLEFIKVNINHLPMYYIPGEEFA